MLIPAIVYKDEIVKCSDILRYSDNMMFYNGCTETGRIEIQTDPTEGRYQWAIVNQDAALVGYIAYMVDYYSSSVYGFGLISFKEDIKAMAEGIRDAMRHVEAMNLNRIEFRCVADNPAHTRYTRIANMWAQKYGYRLHCHILHEIFKDAYGKTHDCIIYELVKEKYNG